MFEKVSWVERPGYDKVDGETGRPQLVLLCSEEYVSQGVGDGDVGGCVTC